jgi:phosphatidylglycerol:prolipoprotein diacylglycerol transferase
LWGRETDVSWAIIFPAGGEVARHPSQLYEAGLEGLLLMVVLLLLFWKTRARFRPGLLVGVFTTLIAWSRFAIEFFREPDAQLADFAVQTGLSMGQWLTIPMSLVGLAMVIYALIKPPLASGKAA